MGISLQNTSTSMMDIINFVNNNTDAQVEAEENLPLPEELLNPELLPQQPPQPGQLKGEVEGKLYAFSEMPKEEENFLSQKFSECTSKKDNSPSAKEPLSTEAKEKECLPSSQTKENTFKSRHTQKQTVEQTKKENISETKTLSKTQQRAHKTIEQLAKTQTKQQAQPFRSSQLLEKKIEKEFSRQQTATQKKNENGKQEVRSPTNTPQTRQTEQKESPLPQMKEKFKEKEEEGFAGQQHKQNQDESEQEQQKEEGVAKVDENFAKELSSYLAEESILSEIFQMRVSHFDVLLLFMEVMKLHLKSREQERISRWIEREHQLKHMQKVVDNYKQAGQWQLFANLGAGLLGIVSGACPIVGHVKGKWVLDKLGGLFSKFRTMKEDMFFKSAMKMTHAMSEMYRSTGQIQNTFSEGDRYLYQQKTDINRTDGEESTRSIDEIKDSWRSVENWIYNTLDMQHKTISQLYNL